MPNAPTFVVCSKIKSYDSNVTRARFNGQYFFGESPTTIRANVGLCGNAGSLIVGADQ